MDGVIQWMTANDKLSGWAQAVGALIAIAIAIAVPALQTMSANRQERLRRAQSVLAASAIVGIAAHAAQTVLDNARRAETESMPLHLVEENFADLCRMVESIEVHALPTAGCVHAIISARQSVRRLSEVIEAASREVAMTIIVISRSTQARISEVRGHIFQAVEELNIEASYIARGEVRPLDD